jgi:5-methylcytosine-specific restriction protein A
MTRAEFGKETKRLALKRSGGLCEAIGKVYGLKLWHRCNAKLSYGVEFDHYPIRAADGGSADLSNCLAVCKKCHKWKTRMFDIPLAAKGKRIADRNSGVRGKAQSFPTNRNGPFKKRMNGRIDLRD